MELPFIKPQENIMVWILLTVLYEKTRQMNDIV